MTTAQIVLMAAPYAAVIVASAAIFATAMAIHNRARLNRIIRRRLAHYVDEIPATQREPSAGWKVPAAQG